MNFTGPGQAQEFRKCRTGGINNFMARCLQSPSERVGDAVSTAFAIASNELDDAHALGQPQLSFTSAACRALVNRRNASAYAPAPVVMPR